MTKDMFLISVFDTTVCDNNLGNYIIMDAVYKNLREMFPEQFFVKLPYLDSIGIESQNYIEKSKYVFLGGTNALSAEMESYKQWGIDRNNIARIKNVILMGVGWWQYQGKISSYTKKALESVLHRSIYHSVRDSYTENKLKSIGYENVINTGCPSLWGITDDICRSIPIEKAENVLTAFTNYSQYPDRDSSIAKSIRENYSRVYVWIQGPEDYYYAKELLGDCEIVAPNLETLDNLLSASINIDYVGTRLHAGIRAMCFRRRAIIIGIDNRAIEMGRDFNLNIVEQENISELDAVINSEFQTAIHLPDENIRRWKSQFEHV